MFTFYNKHKTFDKADKEKLKERVKEAYKLGLAGAEKVEANEAAKAKVITNLAALNTTLSLFSDLNNEHKLVKLAREKVAQEQQWLAHWEKCVAETKRGYAELVAASKHLVDKAYATGALDKEKELQAKIEAERATQAAASREKQKQQQRDKQQQQKIFTVEKMILKGVDGRKKNTKIEDVKAVFFMPDKTGMKH